jgi:hypothetical protein
MKTDDPAFRHIWKMMAADLACCWPNGSFPLLCSSLFYMSQYSFGESTLAKLMRMRD